MFWTPALSNVANFFFDGSMKIAFIISFANSVNRINSINRINGYFSSIVTHFYPLLGEYKRDVETQIFGRL